MEAWHRRWGLGIASGSESDGELGCEEAIVKESEMREKWVVKWEV
jgi:hypothetical protein